MFATSRRGRMLVAAAAAALMALGTACSGNAASVGSGSGSGNSKTVSIAVVQGWDEDVAVSHLWKQLLEKKGYKVKLKQLSISSAFTGVANNQVDVYMDAWLPSTHKTYWQKYHNQLTAIGPWFSPADLVLAVPKYVSDVNSIADLKGKSGEFNGQIVGIEPGAGEMRLAQQSVMPAYGLNQNYRLVKSSTPAMLAQLKSALKAHKPIVVTLWHPHLAFTEFPIKPLKDPKGAWGKPDKLKMVTGKDFAKNHSKIDNWFKKFKMTNKQLGSLEQDIAQKGKGNEDAAVKEWISSHQQLANSYTS